MSGRRPRGPGPSRPKPPGGKRPPAASRAATSPRPVAGERAATSRPAPSRRSASEDSSTAPQRPRKGGPRGGSARRGKADRDRFTVPSTGDAEPMRIQRALARAGVASRRDADRLVAAGRVAVNGVPALTGQLVNPASDIITVDDRRVTVAVSTTTWIVLHKPAGVMTTREDPEGRPTVFDLVDDVPGLVYVGRLDFLTEGLLLLTTDGQAAHRLTHPSREVERTYVAVVRGDAPGAARLAMRGVELEDGLVQPVDVHTEALGERRWAFEITLVDGRTREVRRLCDALGLTVERLVRTRYGPVRLEQLPVGESRPLTARERTVIEALSGAA